MFLKVFKYKIIFTNIFTIIFTNINENKSKNIINVDQFKIELNLS